MRLNKAHEIKALTCTQKLRNFFNMVIDLTSFVWLCVVKLSCNLSGVKPLAFFFADACLITRRKLASLL